ncbi:MAG: hypothetical protein JOY83_15660 [Alphaproteobacteria bacterium]|nr:hypothetical protein [Alphaproteobacteria bacterium]
MTDYNDAIRAPVTLDIVTMNNAHPTHYSDSVEPGVKYILRGWIRPGGLRRVASNTAMCAFIMFRPRAGIRRHALQRQLDFRVRHR